MTALEKGNKGWVIYDFFRMLHYIVALVANPMSYMVYWSRRWTLNFLFRWLDLAVVYMQTLVSFTFHLTWTKICFTKPVLNLRYSRHKSLTTRAKEQAIARFTVLRAGLCRLQWLLKCALDRSRQIAPHPLVNEISGDYSVEELHNNLLFPQRIWKIYQASRNQGSISLTRINFNPTVDK